MRARLIRFAAAVLFAFVAFGQTAGQNPAQNVSRVFQFTYTQAPQGLKEISNAILSTAAITQGSLTPDAKTLTVDGTPGQIAIAKWLFSALDQPAPVQSGHSGIPPRRERQRCDSHFISDSHSGAAKLSRDCQCRADCSGNNQSLPLLRAKRGGNAWDG